jgi:uncharacterized membrane protein YdjX (TVP38/TMEM64 family)
VAAAVQLRRGHFKWGLVAAAVALLVASWRLGLLSLFADPERLKVALLDMGGAGYAAFLGVFALLQPLGVPGIVLVVAASWVWPKPIAFALSVTGSILASATGFLFARFVARDWVAANIPERFRRFDDRIAERGFAAALVLRLVFLMNPFLHGLFGISKIRFRSYLVGSALGYLPGIAVWVWASGAAIDFLRERDPSRYLPWAGAAVACLVAVRVYLWRRNQRQLEASRENVDP